MANARQQAALKELIQQADKPLVVTKPSRLLRLDLGAGQSPAEGFEGVDLWPGSKHVVNLFQFPWPFDDNSVEEIHCSHFIEHIPMEMTQHNGRQKDLFFAFFDECYRILVPGGKMHVICPNARNNRAFQDPTHRRFIVAETFGYLWAEWRKANRLDHYGVECDFATNCNPIVPSELTVLHPEAQARRFNESWNTILDWDARLTSLKKP